MIKAETFIAIEMSLSERLYKAFKKESAKLISNIKAHVKRGEFDKAEGAINKISLREVLESESPYIEYISDLAMLFGSSRVLRDPKTSRVSLGFERGTILQAAQSFKQNLQVNGEVWLKEQARTLAKAYSDRLIKVQKEDRVLHDFESFMDTAGKALFNIAASLHTSRVSAYGFTAEAVTLGLEEYQINEVLDDRTCPVCKVMHGKKFKTKDARTLLDVVLRVTDPHDLEQLQPWPSQTKEGVKKLKGLNTKQLVERGWHIPPFHPRCRGLLGRVGKVPALTEENAGRVQEQLIAQPSDFVAIGITPTIKLVSKWNELLDQLPVDYAAALTLKSPVDLLLAVFNKRIKAYIGIGSEYLGLTLVGSYLEKKKVKQQVRAYKDMLEVRYTTSFSSASDYIRVLKAAFLAAKDTNKSILRADKVGIYDLKPWGFTMVDGMWQLNLIDPEAVAKFVK